MPNFNGSRVTKGKKGGKGKEGWQRERRVAKGKKGGKGKEGCQILMRVGW